MSNLKRFFARMLPYVCAEYTRGRERLITVHTLVRSLPAVHPHMLVQARRLTKALAAHGTFVRSMLFVHVEYVNA